MRAISNLQFEIQKLKFSTEQSHPNKLKWEGIVCLLDQPSDGVPGGAEGLFVMTKNCVEASYETMNGMPLNCRWDSDWFSSSPEYVLTGHDTQFTIGYVTDTWIDENKLMAKGIIWQDNYYDVAYMLTNARPALGFSVEADVTYEQKDNDDKYYSKSVVFTGLATLWKESAAWSDTQLLSLVANRINSKTKEEKVDDINMTPEEMKALFAECTQGIIEEIAKVQAGVDQRFAELEEQKKAEEVAKLEAAKKTEEDELTKLKATNEELQAKLEAASKVIPAPTAGQSAAPKDGATDVTAEFAKINASKDMSFDEKLKARFAVALAAQE